ncbi:SPFH domain-containing protein [Maridesulfovibrio bastinii]|uniref:SPFH domain-containing protein n=1 Tax=Maridesulfovibrio bastinii TaxID=47157 RepID=UPI00042772BF|nr:SPFH domain-containing protein [Maridesulfovibrio bastinii]
MFDYIYYNLFTTSSLINIALLILVIYILKGSIRIVPQKREYIVERLGKYQTTLGAGFHFTIPFVDKVAYQFSLKEEAVDTNPQDCITSDNVGVRVDGLIFVQVVDSRKAAYGIDNYRYAASQLAQTSLRSCIGKLALDKTFEERVAINTQVVEAIDEAASEWGIKVLRYEIKDIIPPESIKQAMEKQVTAERQKRAAIAQSEGDKQAKINRAEASKQDDVLRSQGEKEKRINEAQGQAEAIQLVASATANGIREVAEALNGKGGYDAAQLDVAKKYVESFGNLAQKSTTVLLPADPGNVSAMVATAMQAFKASTRSDSSEDSPAEEENFIITPEGMDSSSFNS